MADLPKIGGAVTRKFGGLPIRTLEPGELITESGLYRMSLDRYHGDCCAGPSVSSSGLRTIEKKSLAHFWVDSMFNPEREPRKESDSMILGAAAHWLLLGEAGFGARFELRPEKAPDGREWHAANASCKKWMADQIIAGKTVVKPDQMKHIRGMAKMLERHPMVQQGLFAGEAELSLIWKDKETGLWLKSRPDVLPAAGEIRCDLKTTTDAAPQACSRTIAEFNLHMQAALVCEAQEALFGYERRDTDCWLAFIETSPPYAVAIRPIDENAIAWGRSLNRRALRKLATAIEKDEWPAYDQDHETVSLPPWISKGYEEQAKLSLLEKPQ